MITEKDFKDAVMEVYKHENGAEMPISVKARLIEWHRCGFSIEGAMRQIENRRGQE